jgi:hypothetical protein
MPRRAEQSLTPEIDRPVLTCAKCGRRQEPGEADWVPQWEDVLELEFTCPECAEPEPE